MAATTTTKAAAPSGISAGVVAATVAGNAIEFFDFLCFSFFAVEISAAFFPNTDAFVGLLQTLATFALGFLFRPLGGIVIGAYADRVGRRPAMLLTVALITFGTMGLALVPSYRSIGAAAPVLLILCRIVQGFALGGEVGPASVFLVEAAPPHRRGFYASWQIASQGLAVAAAGLAAVALSLSLTKAQLADWGWRVPFLLCLALIPVALILRARMPETLEGVRRDSEPGDLGRNVYYVMLGVLVIIGGTVSTYVGNYMSTYATATLGLPRPLALSATLIGGLSTFAFSLLGGWLGDRYGRKRLVLFPRIALALIIWPLFLWLSAQPSALSLWVATVAVTGLTALSAGIGLVILPELLPKRVRATGFAVSYAVGVSIFGGTTQLIVAWLTKASGNAAAPAWYVAFTSLITIAAVFALPETRGRKIE